MRIVRWSVGLVALAVVPLAAAIEGPVAVTGGRVSGMPGRDRSVVVFTGLPFAAPPVLDRVRRGAAPAVRADRGWLRAAGFGP